MPAKFSGIDIVGDMAPNTIIASCSSQCIRVEVIWGNSCGYMTFPAPACIIAHIPIMCTSCDLGGIAPGISYGGVWLFVAEQAVRCIWQPVKGAGRVVG